MSLLSFTAFYTNNPICVFYFIVAFVILFVYSNADLHLDRDCRFTLLPLVDDLVNSTMDFSTMTSGVDMPSPNLDSSGLNTNSNLDSLGLDVPNSNTNLNYSSNLAISTVSEVHDMSRSNSNSNSLNCLHNPDSNSNQNLSMSDSIENSNNGTEMISMLNSKSIPNFSAVFNPYRIDTIPSISTLWMAANRSFLGRKTSSGHSNSRASSPHKITAKTSDISLLALVEANCTNGTSMVVPGESIGNVFLQNAFVFSSQPELRSHIQDSYVVYSHIDKCREW